MQPGQLLLILAVDFWSSEERERKRRQRAERSMLISSKDTLTEHHSYPHTTTTTTITTTRKRPQITNSPETQQPDRQVSKSSKQGNGYEMTSCQRSHSCWPGAGSRQAADDDGDEIDDGRPRSRLSKQRSDGSGSQCRRHHFGCHQIKTKTIAAATAAAASETVTSCEKVQLLERHHQADGVPPAWCSREHKGVKFRRRRSVGPVILANDGGGGGLWQRSSLFAYLEVGILLVMSAVVSASQQQSALVPSEDSSGSRSIPSAQEKLQTVSTAASNQNRHEQLDTNIPSLETPSSTKPFNGTLVAGSSRSLASGEDKAAVVGFGNGELELLRRSPWPPRTNSQFDSSTQEAIAAAAAQLGPTGIISVGNDRRGPNIKLANRLASLERQDTGEPVLDATVPISSIQDKNGNNDNEDNNSNNNNNETDDYETGQSAMAPFRLGGERAEHSSSGGSSLTDVLEARSGSIQGKASGGDGNSVGYQVLLVRAHSSAASIRGLSRRRRFDENQDLAGASQMVVGSGGMNSGSGNSGDEPTEQLQAQTISGGWPGDLQAAPASSGGGTGWAGGELSGAGAQNNPNDVDYNPGSDHEHEHETATGVQVDQVRDPGEGGVDQASHESSLNESANACEELERIVQTRPSKAAGRAFIVCYTIIFIAGLFGNVITLYVLICKGKKRSAQDLLLGNLAISDIMLCVFAVPITPKYLVLDYYWKMGPILCKLVSFTQSVSVYMSTYSLIAIGYIRYRLIVHPLEEAMSHARAFLFCAGTLVIGMLTTAPYVMKVHLSPENCEVKFCDEAWVGSQRFYFSLFTFIFQFVIPLVAVIFFYFNIYRRLDHRTHAGISSSSSTSVATKSQGPSTSHPSTAAATTSGYQQQQAHSNHHHQNTTFEQAGHHQQHVASGVLAIKEIRHRERQRRMKKNNMRLIFVVIIFAHSWLPLNLYNILSDYFDGLSNWAYLTNAFLVAHLIACSSVIWNPILYAWMSDSYQMDLKCAMPKCLAAKFKSCLKEPGHASGHGGGGVGGPTSIVMVSTNGNNHQLHAGTTTTTTTTTNANSISNNNKRFFDFRPSGTGCVAGSTPAPGANPNGLAAADLAGPSQQQQPLQPPSKARSIDQISEVVCLHGLEEQRRELCGQDAADGLAATKSLETLGESKELHEGHHHHCCQGSLTDDDGEGEEEDECDSGTHEIHLANAQMTDSRDNTDTEQYLIDVCRQRVTRLSNGDNNSSQANNIKLRQNNNTSNTTSNNNNNNTNDNNGLEPWT